MRKELSSSASSDLVMEAACKCHEPSHHQVRGLESSFITVPSQALFRLLSKRELGNERRQTTINVKSRCYTFSILYGQGVRYAHSDVRQRLSVSERAFLTFSNVTDNRLFLEVTQLHAKTLRACSEHGISHRGRVSKLAESDAPVAPVEGAATLGDPDTHAVSYEDALVEFRETGDYKRLWRDIRALREAQTPIENGQLNTLMMACIRRKKPDVAIRIFHELEPLVLGSPNIECYTTLIVAYGRLRQADKAVEILNELQARCRTLNNEEQSDNLALCPSLRTYNAVMNACVAAGDVDKAHQVFGEMVDAQGIAPNEVSYNILLKSHARRGRVEAMQLVLDQMRAAGCAPSLVTYTTLVKGYVTANKLEKAEEVLNDILYKKRLEPDSHLFNCLLEGYVRANDWKKALKLADTMRQHGTMPDGYTNTQLVKVCIQAGRFDLAEKIVERMPRPLPLQIYSMMISGYGDSGRLWSALRLAKEMRNDGVHENVRTVSAQMSACLQAREPALALSVFLRVMREDPSFVPDQVIYTLLIRANGLRADVDSAYQIFSLVKTKYYTVRTEVYNALIEAAMLSGRDDLALSALDELIEKSPGVNEQTFQDLTCVCLVDQQKQFRFLSQVWNRLRPLGAPIDGRFYARFLEVTSHVGDLELARTLIRDRWAGHFLINGATAQEVRSLEAYVAGREAA
jgi:pentatricopeptide repeat protein